MQKIFGGKGTSSKYEYFPIISYRSLTSHRKALLLGSGFVTKPTLSLLSDRGVEVTVACRTLSSAQDICKDIKNAKAISLDVENSEALDGEVGKTDIAISLIPYTFHLLVIKSAIRQRKDVVTTSYTSPAMLELEREIQEAGITVMNEIGLDPGLVPFFQLIFCLFNR